MKKRGTSDIVTWIGSEALLDLYNKSPSNDHKKVFATLFESGGRVSEVIGLKVNQFSWNNECLLISNMRVLKRGQKNFRDVIIPRRVEEPLVEELISFIEQCEFEYFFPRRAPFSGDKLSSGHVSRATVYRMCREINNLFPHWFRSIRASFLAHVYGFNVFDLRDWFMWRGISMPLKYVRPLELAKKLGVKSLPTVKTPFLAETPFKPTISPKTAEKKSPIVKKKKVEKPVVDIYALLSGKDKKVEKPKPKKKFVKQKIITKSRKEEKILSFEEYKQRLLKNESWKKRVYWDSLSPESRENALKLSYRFYKGA